MHGKSISTLFGVAALALALTQAGGCASSASSESSGSISDSFGSISDSLVSPFESSSDSSGGDDSSYRSDLESLTLAFVEAGAGVVDPTGSFVRAIGRVAEDHGVTDWESVPGTYVALGAGLQRAGMGEAAARGFGRKLFGSDPRAEALLLQAYTVRVQPS